MYVAGCEESRSMGSFHPGSPSSYSHDRNPYRKPMGHLWFLQSFNGRVSFQSLHFCAMSMFYSNPMLWDFILMGHNWSFSGQQPAALLLPPLSLQVLESKASWWMSNLILLVQGSNCKLSILFLNLQTIYSTRTQFLVVTYSLLQNLHLNSLYMFNFEVGGAHFVLEAGTRHQYIAPGTLLFCSAIGRTCQNNMFIFFVCNFPNELCFRKEFELNVGFRQLLNQNQRHCQIKTFIQKL